MRLWPNGFLLLLSFSVKKPALIEAIQDTGKAYEAIGGYYAEQPKFDLHPLYDGLQEYRGLLSTFPDAIGIVKVCTVEKQAGLFLQCHFCNTFAKFQSLEFCGCCSFSWHMIIIYVLVQILNFGRKHVISWLNEYSLSSVLVLKEVREGKLMCRWLSGRVRYRYYKC